MGNYIGRTKCEICKKKKATLYRSIAGRLYYLCDDEKCNFKSLLRTKLLTKRDINFKQNQR